MLKKQKRSKKIIRFVSHVGIHVMVRAGVLAIAVSLVVVAAYPHQNVSSKKPLPNRPATQQATARHTAPKHTAAIPTATTSQPQVATAVPTPAPTPAPQVATPAPKVVVPAPNSNVSGLKPSSTASTTSTSGSNTGTSTGSSGGSSSSSSRSQTQPPVGYSSTNWSGYMTTTSTYTGVSAAWVVPSVTGNGTSNSANGTWIGIGGVTTGDLIQTGTQDIVSASGTVNTSAFYEMLPQASITIPGVRVSPGDSVSATITELSAASWNIAFTDLSDSQTYTISVTYASSESSAEWIEEDPSYANGSLVPLANFGSATFSGGTVITQGSTVTIASSKASPITLVTTSGKVVAVPSNLTADGGGFTVTQQ